MNINWIPADLSAWGEHCEIKGRTYRKTWDYSEKMKNKDGLAFYLWLPDGTKRGPFETEEEVDDLLMELEGEQR